MSTTNNNQTIHAKLNEARKAFRAKAHPKTGKNEYANYEYSEAADFIPDACEAYENAGICGVISYGIEFATHTTTDVENPASPPIVITVPMREVKLPGCHPAQNMGAMMTYYDRYLWKQAIQLAEKDVVDASKPLLEEAKTETLPKDRFVAKKFPAVVEKKAAPHPSAGELWAAVTISNVKPYQRDGWKKPMYWVELEDERSAFCWEEPLANDAKIMVGQTVNLRVKRSSRDASKFEYLGFDAIETAQDELDMNE
jgi:hypothetical protein